MAHALSLQCSLNSAKQDHKMQGHDIIIYGTVSLLCNAVLVAGLSLKAITTKVVPA